MNSDRFIPHLREFLSSLEEEECSLASANQRTKWKRSLRSLRREGLGPSREQEAAIYAVAWELFFRINLFEQLTQENKD